MDIQLHHLRQQIDTIDDKILQLLNQRAAVVEKVAEVKRACTQDDNPPVFFYPQRESLLLQRLAKKSLGPLSIHSISRIFREIMSSCLILQEKENRIAYHEQTELPTLFHPSNSIEWKKYESITSMTQAIKNTESPIGVAPIESTSEGFYHPTVRSILRASLKIHGEFVIRKHNRHLLQPAGNRNVSIDKIYGSLKDFMQCQHWLKKHYPKTHYVIRDTYDELISEEHIGMIGTDQMVSTGQYRIVHLNISDISEEYTRFFLLKHASDIPYKISSLPKKAAITITFLPQTSLTLSECLILLQSHAVDILNIAVHPIPCHTTYYLFFETTVSSDFEKRMEAIKAACTHQATLDILGVFPSFS